MRRRNWLVISTIALSLGMALVGASLPARAQQSGQLKVDPATQQIASGANFTVRIVQNAGVVTAGAQTDVTFNAGVVQVVDIKLGEKYSSASLVMGVSGGTTGAPRPQSKAEAIVSANQTGTLQNVAAFYLPGQASVPAGDAVVFEVTMRALKGGTSPLTLGEVSMLDETGVTLTVTATNGNVTVTGGTAPPPAGTPTAVAGVTGTPTAEATPTGTPSGEVTAVSTVLSGESVPASVAVSPDALEVAVEEEFSVDITMDSEASIASFEADMEFKNSVLELMSIEPGDDWSDALGADDSTLESAVQSANEEGKINALAFAKPSGGVSPGETTVLTLNFRGQQGKNGESDVKLTRVELEGAEGSTVGDVSTKNGKITVGSGESGSSNTLLFVIIGVVAIAAAGAGGAYWYMRRQGA